MARKLTDGILQGFLDYTEETEIPDIFSFWVGVSSVSAALGRDCFLDMGHFSIYPNMYIVLVAGSAVCRKSSAISVAGKLIAKIEPKVHMLSQKMTPEAMIGSLSGLDVKDENMLINEASGIFVVDELSTLIDKNAFQSGMIPLLTKLYDCEDFDYATKSRGVELIKNPCLSILGGSTLCWIKGSVPTVAVGGGFTSRVVFVYKESNSKLKPFPIMTKENKDRWDDISRDLSVISRNMRGGFAMKEDAKERLSSEYMAFMGHSELLTNPHLSGYAGRRQTTLLKLCMIISAARHDSRLIDLEDVKVGTTMMREAEINMPKILQAISSEFVGDICEEVLNVILHRKVVPRSELVKLTKHRLTVRQLDVIVETLVEEGVVRIDREGSRLSYIFCGGKE